VYKRQSLYDGGTALYEGIAMAVRANNRSRIVIDSGVNPLFRRIVKTYAINLEIEIIEAEPGDIATDRKGLNSLVDEDTAVIVVQNPNFFGVVDDYGDIFTHARSKGAVCIQVFYPLSLGILKTPGEIGADIAIGEGQSLGLPLSFGGPYLGVMAVNKKYIRKMPGRIAGETVDTNGNRAFVLTLQAREQHIRREKATSNICSNQALCALRAVVYLSLLGKEGFRQTALMNLERAEYLKEGLKGVKGIEVPKGQTFNEFTITLPKNARETVSLLLEEGYVAGLPASLFYENMDNRLIVSATEKRSVADIDAFIAAVSKVLK
jgi:glycine dehydrogenase subunit 1